MAGIVQLLMGLMSIVFGVTEQSTALAFHDLLEWAGKTPEDLICSLKGWSGRKDIRIAYQGSRGQFSEWTPADFDSTMKALRVKLTPDGQVWLDAQLANTEWLTSKITFPG